MINLETVIAMAVRHESVMAQLGETLRSDIVVASPHLRRIVEFADDFLMQRRKLPASGDFEAWLQTMHATPMIQDGAREKLGDVLAIDTTQSDPEFFVEATWPQIEKAAHHVAMQRINEADGTPEAWKLVHDKLAALKRRGTATKLFPTTVGELRERAKEALEQAVPEELIPRLAWRGRHVILSGAPKAGKSTYVAAGVSALALGQPFLDGFTERGKTLWLGLDESSSDAVQRLIANAGLTILLSCSVVRPSDPYAFLRAALTHPDAAQRPDLIVVDSLLAYARLVLGGEAPASGDAAQWANVMRPLTDLAHDFPVGIASLHHARRSDGAFRDSGEIKAAVDALIEMHPPFGSQSSTTRNITIEGRRSITKRSHRYTVELATEPVERFGLDGLRETTRDIYTLGAGSAQTVSEDIAGRIVAFITDHPGCSGHALTKAVGNHRKVIDALIASGEIKRAGARNGYTYSIPERADA